MRSGASLQAPDLMSPAKGDRPLAHWGGPALQQSQQGNRPTGNKEPRLPCGEGRSRGHACITKGNFAKQAGRQHASSSGAPPPMVLKC
ncbi:hypothetical protein EYF80_057662 [Liparis tanakae]|uniref:Uncharacterized protein n=1 Tax=Liparis tanakae TaxID=230148 RepID=A0A4Z2ETR1_9TELE|nr:hypothetical protein EYF80_057662 [Liparis tanakae]